MKKVTACLAALSILATSATVFAMYSVADRGTWPATWPKELEPLRSQSRTLVGPLVEQQHFEIPFAKRENFEAAWPHLLKIKGKGAPLILVRSPNDWLGSRITAGVRVHAPPVNSANSETPIPAQQNVRVRWMNTTFIELIVDGNIVDLNRIPIPADTPIIDERFTDAKNQESKPTQR